MKNLLLLVLCALALVSAFEQLSETQTKQEESPPQQSQLKPNADTGVDDSARFEVVDYPGAAETIASAINSRGDVVGRYDIGRREDPRISLTFWPL